MKLKDGFNRVIDYARISVTDKCNFRCTYCMPEASDDKAEILSDDEILKIVSGLARNGVKYIKVTGGEPLVRKGIFELIEKIKQINGIKQVTITTNGALLTQFADKLHLVDGINISIDAIDEDLFKSITGFVGSTKIIDTIRKLEKNGVENIKINCVLIKNCNESEYIEIARLSKDMDICIKFIEMMPIGHGSNFDHFTLEELKSKLYENFGEMKLIDGKYGNGPAQYYKISGHVGKIGLIGAVSHKFCENCNRIRITSDGLLKTCLQFESGTDLKPYFDTGDIAEVIRKAVCNKQEGHRFDEIDFENKENRLMSQIGG